MVFLGIRYDNRDYSFYRNVVNSCCVDLLVCWGTNKHIRASVDTAGLFSKKIPFTDSNPTAAYDGLCVQSFFYYDVFLITNQRAISFSLTAFFICTFLLIVFDMLILGRNALTLTVFLPHTICIKELAVANVQPAATDHGMSPTVIFSAFGNLE